MTRQRVAVIGVGTIGSQALHALALRGADAVGFEQFTPGHAQGAAGGEGRILRRVLGREPGYWPLIDRAFALWRERERDSGRVILDQIGTLSTGPAGSSALELLQAESAVRSIAIDVLSASELRRAFPFQRVGDDDIGVVDREGGMIRSELANLLTAQLAETRGAQLRSRCTVRRLTETTHGVEVVTDSGTEIFDQAIVTTGAWARQLSGDVAALVAVHKPISAWFAPRDADLLMGAPAFTRADPRQYYGIPTADARLVKLGFAGTVQTAIPGVPSAADAFVAPEELEGFVPIVEEHFPGLHPQPVRVNAYFEGYTADARPILQRTSDRVTTAIGFSGDGFKLAPVYGELAAELALGADTQLDIAFLQRHLGARV